MPFPAVAAQPEQKSTRLVWSTSIKSPPQNPNYPQGVAPPMPYVTVDALRAVALLCARLTARATLSMVLKDKMGIKTKKKDHKDLFHGTIRSRHLAHPTNQGGKSKTVYNSIKASLGTLFYQEISISQGKSVHFLLGKNPLRK